MTTRLIIARHGNTFGPQDTPTRIGARTDLPLVASGMAQARRLGAYLRHHQMLPDVVFASRLQRAYDTARLALEASGHEVPIRVDRMFDEIDYGPDENRPEAAVIARLGPQALQGWDEQATVPPGWQVDPQAIINNWLAFGDRCCTDFAGQTILVVTSNGIARFVPHLTGDFEGFAQTRPIKVATGALCVLCAHNRQWQVAQWNVRPA